MIHQQIKKYEEPVTKYISYSSSHSTTKTDEEKAEWALKVQEDLEEVKKYLDIGDTVIVRNSYSTQRVTIHELLTDPEKIFPYKDRPCLIMATNPKYGNTGPTRFALHELDLTTVEKKNHVSE